MNSGLFFYIFKSVARCKYLDMLIEGRIGTRVGSEHYGQYDKKLYDMELEELGRSGWQDEKLLSEVRKLLEKNKASIQVEDKTGREGVDLAFAIAEIGEEIGFTQGFKCALQLRTRAPVFVR